MTTDRHRADLRHLKQVARGLYSAGLYATYRDALVMARVVRGRIDEQRVPWADQPQPRFLRFRAMVRRALGASRSCSRYARARNLRAGCFTV